MKCVCGYEPSGRRVPPEAEGNDPWSQTTVATGRNRRDLEDHITTAARYDDKGHAEQR